MAQGLKQLKQQFLEYIEIEKGRAFKTIENYDHQLGRFLEFLKSDNPEKITPDSVREYRLWLNRQPTGHNKAKSETLSKKTQNYYLIALRAFLKYLARQGIKSLQPEHIELAKVGERSLNLITPAELQRLLDSPKGNDIKNLRDKAVLELLFSTGMRLSELCSLTSDINLKSDELSIRGKGGKVRVVFLSDGAKKAVADYLAARKDMSEALFVRLERKSGKKKGENKDIQPINKRSIERIVKEHAIKAGISKRVTPHMIRHCLHPDTLIFLPHTVLSAKELSETPSKKIMAVDFQKGMTIKSKIIQKSIHKTSGLINISANGYDISVSKEHRFFTIGKFGVE